MILFAAGNAKAFWYLTRGTGVVALLLLTAALVLGVASTLRWRSYRLPRFVVADLHRNLTLLAIAFVVVHVVTSFVDGFAPIRLVDAVIPFVSAYRPIWLGLGAVAFDLLLALVVTSLLRAWLGFRIWRLVHWLAYAAWPVALVHGLGTGSDGRFGWFTLVAFGCLAAVALTVAARLLSGDATAGFRVAAGLAAVGGLILVVGWYRSGPAQKGWAARAGTPSTLLRTRTQAASKTPTTAVSSPQMNKPFDGRLDARLARSSDASGDVGVAIEGNVLGKSVEGVLRLTLWGTESGSNGVAMTTSRVTFSPVGAKPYSGSVTALSGDNVVADLTNASGGTLRLSLVLSINAQTSTVTGQVHGGSA